MAERRWPDYKAGLSIPSRHQGGPGGGEEVVSGEDLPEWHNVDKAMTTEIVIMVVR
jgi:hypothetical protein